MGIVGRPHAADAHDGSSIRNVGGVAPTYGNFLCRLWEFGNSRLVAIVPNWLMPRYRRYFAEGQTVFLTLVTDGRRPWLFREAIKNEVLTALRETREHHRFKHHGHVLLHDHLHLLLSPHCTVEIPRLISSFKLSILARLKVSSANTDGRLWQRQYYDYIIRDAEDFARHLDYLHFNPVKHGLASQPAAWRWSSFRQWRKRGLYPENWGCHEPENIRDISE